MEGDTIRASGSSTLIDLWVEGKVRAIRVTRAAIETYLGSSAPSNMSDDDRCSFVRSHLAQVVSAAKTQLREGDPTLSAIVIDAGQLGGAGDRRRNDRRKGERRKKSQPAAELPHGERRRADRRKIERRKSARPKGS